MRAPAWLAVALASALAACALPADEAPGPLLPGLDARLATIESIELRGAGDAVLATLDRGPAGWTVRERDGWPADRTGVRTLLRDLAAAHRVEAMTAKADRHARIGVDALAAPDARGIEVRLRGKGWNDAVLVGDAAPANGGRFVRLPAQAQAWRVDRPLELPREAAAWLDTRLSDVPLVHVATVHSHDDAGHAFDLAHRDDRFRIVDAPSAAMGDSYRGDTLAGLLEDLRFEDVAADDGHAAERTVEYALDDDRRVRLESWRVDGRIWVRVRECGEDTAPDDCATPARWLGRRFLLPAPVAANLWLTRDQVLGRTR
jgi:hypothetical protein